MDPQEQFKERYKAYVSQRGVLVNASPSNVPPPPPPKKFSPNKFYVLGVIVGFLLLTPLVSYIYFVNKATPPSKIASNEQQTTTSTQPTDAQINAQMQKIWGSYYDKVKNDPKYRDAAKQNLINQQLIQNGLAQNNIKMTSVSGDTLSQQQQKEETLLMPKVLNNRNIDYAFVFVNPEDPNYDTNVAKINTSYNLLKAQISQGKTMQQAYTAVKSDPRFFKPIAITTSRLIYKNTFEKSISDKIFTFTKGQTTDLIDSGGGTFILAHVNSANNTPYNTMDEWLTAQKGGQR